MTQQAISAVLSAVFWSQSITSVVLLESEPELPIGLTNDVASEADKELIWRWIALALFSSYAPNRVSKIKLQVSTLRRQDIDTMRTIVENPSLWFLNDRHAPLRTVVASSFRPASPHSPGDECDLRMEPQRVCVIHDDGTSDWVEVLLPGYGSAWTRRDETKEGDVLVRRECPLKELSLLDATDENLPAVLELLRLVGSTIELLDIVFETCDRPIDSCLLDVFNACPHLKSLYVDQGQLESLDVISDSLQDGTTRSPVFLLRHLRVHEPTSVPRFFVTLGDPDHPMSRIVEDFVISIEEAARGAPEVVEAFDAALETNYKVRDLNVRITYPQNTVDTTFTSGKYNRFSYDKYASVRAAPLKMSRKLAFLSVADHSDSLRLMTAW